MASLRKTIEHHIIVGSSAEIGARYLPDTAVEECHWIHLSALQSSNLRFASTVRNIWNYLFSLVSQEAKYLKGRCLTDIKQVPCSNTDVWPTVLLCLFLSHGTWKRSGIVKLYFYSCLGFIPPVVLCITKILSTVLLDKQWVIILCRFMRYGYFDDNVRVWPCTSILCGNSILLGTWPLQSD